MKYEYSARVVRWIDGDTVVLDVDLGFYMRSTQSFRLYGINTPELRPKKGTEDERAVEKIRANQAKRYCEVAAPPESTVRIETSKAGKFGRWLALVYIPDADDSLNKRLVDEGLAVRYMAD